MQIGSLTVELLSEGKFEIFRDGHINRSLDDKEETSDASLSIVKKPTTVGVNPILVRCGKQNVLLDTGLGWGLDAGSGYAGVSNVCTNLAIFGLKPKDITHVVLTHLHYDHAAGCSYTDASSKTQATFPNATYYLHEEEWNFALSQADHDSGTRGTGYQLDEFYRLMADKRVKLLHGKKTEILKGITLIQTGGHTPGHQMVRLKSGDECACYPGELIPSSLHLNHYSSHRQDSDPIQAKKAKIRLLKKAYRQQAVLLFYHSKHGQSGRLIKDDDKQYVLADIPKG